MFSAALSALASQANGIVEEILRGNELIDDMVQPTAEVARAIRKPIDLDELMRRIA